MGAGDLSMFTLLKLKRIIGALEFMYAVIQRARKCKNKVNAVLVSEEVRMPSLWHLKT